MKLKKKYIPINYEMIICWNTDKRPFVSQKLGFKASPKFNEAFADAEKLLATIYTVGGLSKKAVKLVAVTVKGALDDWQDENAPFLKRKKEELAKQIKTIIAKGSDKSSKNVLAFAKAKKAKEDEVISFKLNTNDAKKKAVTPPARIVNDVEPMIHARKEKIQAKKASGHEKAEKSRSKGGATVYKMEKGKGKSEREANRKLKATVKASATKEERKATRVDKTVAKGFSRQTLSGRRNPRKKDKST